MLDKIDNNVIDVKKIVLKPCYCGYRYWLLADECFTITVALLGDDY